MIDYQQTGGPYIVEDIESGDEQSFNTLGAATEAARKLAAENSDRPGLIRILKLESAIIIE